MGKKRFKINEPPLYFKSINAIILSMLALTMIMPVWNIIVLSFTSDLESFENVFKIWPREPSINGYVVLFGNIQLWVPFLNNVYVTVIATLLHVIVNSMAGFALTRRKFAGKAFLVLIFLIPMMIPGEAIIIPKYITMKNLALIDKLWAVILDGVGSTFAIFLMRNYLLSIPTSLEESAVIDGAGLFRIFLRIYLPLSKAGLATITLLEMVGKWNHLFSAVFYLHSRAKLTLQIAIQTLVINTESTDFSGKIVSNNIRAAAVFVALLPMILLYPYIQKYFIKGIFLGGIKE